MMKHVLWILLCGAVLGRWASPGLASGDSPAQSPATTADRNSTMPAPGDEAGNAPSSFSFDTGAIVCDSTVDTDDLLLSAREMFLADNYALAEMLYTCILRRDPNHLSAMLELSIVFETTGKLQYAKELLKRATVLRPHDREVLGRNNEVTAKLSRALRSDVDRLIAKGAFQAAIPKLSALLATEPTDADLHYKKAQCHLELGDAGSALEEIDKALELQKEAPYFALRSEALKLGSDREIGALTREAKRLLGTGGADNRDRALAVVSQILTKDPENRWAKRQFMMLVNGGASATTGDTSGLAAASDTSKPLIETAKQHQAARIAAYAAAAAAYAAALALGAVQSLHDFVGALIALLIALIVLRSPLFHLMTRGFAPRHSLAGRLNLFNIQEILTMIHAQARSGVLRVYAGSVKGCVYFGDGEIHHCTCGKLEGRDAFRSLLAGAKEGYFVLTELPRTFRKTIDAPFSLVLMDVGDKSFLENGKPSPETPESTLDKKTKMKSLLENRP
jgi:tetratricopeptide (TPR) repeat protein